MRHLREVVPNPRDFQRVLSAGKHVPRILLIPSVGLFTNGTAPRLTRHVTGHLCASLNSTTMNHFDSNRIDMRVGRGMHNNSVFVVRSAYTPAGSGLVRLIIVISTLHHTSTNHVATIVPCFNCTHRSHHIHSTHMPVATGIITSFLSDINISHILAISLRTRRVRNFFSIPISGMFNDPVLLRSVLRLGLSGPVIISPSVNNIIHTHTVTGLLGSASVTVVSGHHPHTGISRIVRVVNSITNHSYMLISSVVSANNALYGTTRTLGRHNTGHMFTCTARPVFSNGTTGGLHGSMVSRIIIYSAVPLDSRVGSLPGIHALALSNVLTRTVHHVDGRRSVSTVFRRWSGPTREPTTTNFFIYGVRLCSLYLLRLPFD